MWCFHMEGLADCHSKREIRSKKVPSEARQVHTGHSVHVVGMVLSLSPGLSWLEREDEHQHMPALSSGNEWHLQHALTWNNRRGVGFFLCWLEDQLIQSYIFLVNWLNNGVFGENVGSCTQVSDEAVLKDRNLHLLCESSSV